MIRAYRYPAAGLFCTLVVLPFLATASPQKSKEAVPVLKPAFTVFKPAPRPQAAWTLLNGFGIQVGSQWLGGRVTDALEIGDGQALAATDSSGVWWLRRTVQAIPLSMDWTQTQTVTLAKNTGHPRSYFAAGRDETNGLGILFETRQGDPAPLLAPWNQVALPPGTGSIHRILTLSAPPRIVLASDTGIVWAMIPVSVGPYVWHAATGSVSGGFYDVKEGPSGTVIAGSVFFNPAAGGTPIRRGLWLLSGKPGVISTLRLDDVTIRSSTAEPYNASTMFTTSVAVCEGDRTVAYAASSNPTGRQWADGQIRHVYKSVDGGRSWDPKLALDAVTGQPFGPEREGRQANGFTNSIAVSPSDSTALVVGCVHLWGSNDSGDHFTSMPATHDDHHTLFFASNRLYDCSDGGLAVGNGANFSGAFDTQFNVRLPTLMFYRYTADIGSGGRLTLGGGLQDFSSPYCSWLGNGAPAAWKFFEGTSSGDSAPVVVTPAGAAWSVASAGVYHFSSVDNAGAFHDAGPMTIDANPGNGGNPCVPTWRSFKVPNPAYRDPSRRLMYALTSTESGTGAHQGHIYGMFSWPGQPAVYRRVADVDVPAGGMIASLGSYDGNVIYVGLGPSCAMLAIDLRTGARQIQSGVSTSGNAFIDGIAAGSSWSYFATRLNPDGSSTLLQLSKGAWFPVTGLPPGNIASLICDGPTRTFVACGTKVYMSENDRSRWQDISAGLPKDPHPSQLLVSVDANGKHALYLTTFGWSVWRYPIN